MPAFTEGNGTFNARAHRGHATCIKFWILGTFFDFLLKKAPNWEKLAWLLGKMLLSQRDFSGFQKRVFLSELVSEKNKQNNGQSHTKIGASE